MGAHLHAAPAVSFWPLALMWFGMMAVMMAPTAYPWVRAYHRFSATERDARFADSARFASGYLFAWFAYAAAAALLQRGLQSAALMQPSSDIVSSRLGAMILLIAGLYQFAPLKRACLTHCRTPFGYFLRRWRNGPMGAFKMGLHHGFFCVGCCWVLMATAFAVGVMNVWWMAALAALGFVEQMAPYGELARHTSGMALVAAAVRELV